MARHDEGFFSAKDNLRLFWESDLPDGEPKAHVAILHGYMDHIGRFRRVTDFLVGQGFGVHGFDMRGHGQSDGRRSHVDRFDDYLDDALMFWARVRKQAGAKKTFLLGHSHGGLIAAYLMEQGLEGLGGAVLTSPFFGFAFKPPFVKVQVSKLVGKLIPWLPVKEPLKVGDLTRDPELQREAEKDPLRNVVVTPRWFMEATDRQAKVISLASRIQAPLFLLLGTSDPISEGAAIRKFFEGAGSADKKLKEYPGMVHELMNDLGKEEVWKDISSWISAHL